MPVPYYNSFSTEPHCLGPPPRTTLSLTEPPPLPRIYVPSYQPPRVIFYERPSLKAVVDAEVAAAKKARLARYYTPPEPVAKPEPRRFIVTGPPRVPRRHGILEYPYGFIYFIVLIILAILGFVFKHMRAEYARREAVFAVRKKEFQFWASRKNYHFIQRRREIAIKLRGIFALLRLIVLVACGLILCWLVLNAFGAFKPPKRQVMCFYVADYRGSTYQGERVRVCQF